MSLPRKFSNRSSLPRSPIPHDPRFAKRSETLHKRRSLDLAEVVKTPSSTHSRLGNNQGSPRTIHSLSFNICLPRVKVKTSAEVGTETGDVHCHVGEFTTDYPVPRSTSLSVPGPDSRGTGRRGRPTDRGRLVRDLSPVVPKTTLPTCLSDCLPTDPDVQTRDSVVQST